MFRKDPIGSEYNVTSRTEKEKKKENFKEECKEPEKKISLRLKKQENKPLKVLDI